MRLVCRVPAWVATLVVAAAIAYLTLARFDMDPDDVPRIPHLDKVVHFLMFGGLAWMAAIDYAAHLSGPRLRRVRPVLVVVVCAVGASLAGAAVEVAQGAMGLGRSEDVFDWLADTVGAVVGAAIAFVMIQYWRQLLSRRQ